jgi:hypothetical protein
LFVDSKREKTIDLYTKEIEGKTPCWLPKPEPEAEHQRWGWASCSAWGQARLVGAGEVNGGRKPPASCPSPPALNTEEATGPIPSQHYEWKASSTEQYKVTRQKKRVLENQLT